VFQGRGRRKRHPCWRRRREPPFSSRPALQRLDCGRGRTRIKNFISVSVVTRSVHADSPLEHNAFSSNEGRHCDPWALGPGGKQTKGANGAAPSGRATSKHDKGAKGARRGWIARLPSPSEDGRLSTHFALVQDDCSIASQQFNLLTFGTIEYILFIRKSPSSGDGL
jgi:hypothetical protein